MRRIGILPLLYVLFLVQSLLAPWGPDLLLVSLVALAVHEDRVTAALLAFFGGLCLDLLSPSTMGAGILTLTVLAYAAASLRAIVYRARWYVLALVLAGFLLKFAVLALAGAGSPGPAPLVVSGLLTLGVAFPVEMAVARVFYPGWKAS